MKTINRLWLKNQILKGNIEAKCDGLYTDDYAWDAAIDFGRTDWLPACIAVPGNDENGRWSQNYKEGYLNFGERDFRGYGRAWAENDELGKNGPISLYFGYRSYTLRLKQAVKQAA